MSSAKIRQKFLDFFQTRGHVIRQSSSLIPDDPSVLLTTAGMQQFKLYFTGDLSAQEDFRLPSGEPAKGVVTIQKCFRTSDIDEVGDDSHLTFFEMLGNFSFGGYFKKEAIEYAHEFITKELGLKIDYISVFEGNKEVPADLESEKIWQSLGIKDIRRCGREDNFWGPTGSEGPCGPTTEIYVNGVEVWNIVFNEYFQDSDGHLEPLMQKGVDTGMGFERLVTEVQNKSNIFETDLFESILKNIPAELSERTRRILADHARGIAFLISDGVLPSNKDQGYILRRLMRRVITHEQINLNKEKKFSSLDLLKTVAEEYKSDYPNLNKEKITGVWREESDKFTKTLSAGLKELEKLTFVDSVSAFRLYESYGLPFEIIKEINPEKSKNLTRENFDKEFAKHQEVSRAGAEKKFGGHGLVLNTGELKAGSEEEMKKVLRLHTATHLLHRALREVLGSEVGQAGSDITPERTRFDFSFPRKVTPEEIKKVEDLVNQKIKENLPVNFVELPKSEAEKTGALFFFKQKYPERVKVYFVGDTLESAWSKEFCGGPHVSRTGEIGEFKISKEEAISAGVRRIRAVIYP
ncbi:MAG: alanine--tRNA ligase [Candidatus Paceibacterota bacterium]|jgi:alanyl-tRNA synthetase